MPTIVKQTDTRRFTSYEPIELLEQVIAVLSGVTDPVVHTVVWSFDDNLDMYNVTVTYDHEGTTGS